MSVYIDVVRPNPFVPNTDVLDRVIHQEHLSKKDFARRVLGKEFGLVCPKELEEVATRIHATHSALARVLREIADHGGMIQVS